MDDSRVTTNSTILDGHSSQVSTDSVGSQETFMSAYHQNDVTYWVGTAVPPVLLVLGFYGNVMTIMIMHRMRASGSTGCLPVYFTTLAVSDLFLLCTQFMSYWPEIALNKPLTYFHDLSCTVPFYVIHMFAMTSAWLLVAMTCQRMTSVVVPHRVELLCSVKRGKIVTALVFILSCVFNVSVLFCFHVEYLEEGYPSCVGKDKHVARIYTLLYICFASLLPFLCLLAANSVLIFGVIQSVKMSGKMMGNENTSSSRLTDFSSMTMTLILTSAAFLVITLPFCVTDMYLDSVGFFNGEIEDEARNEQLALLEMTCIVLYMANSAINFYIYILSGRKFRQEAKKYLCFWFTN